jgi:hypothetical protein
MEGAVTDAMQPRETAAAKAAYAAYVALGPSRSLAKLRDALIVQGHTGKPSAILRQLEAWSSQHGWQRRLADMAEAQLAEAEDLRRSVYLTILREYARRFGENGMADAARTDELHGVYDRVKPAEAAPLAGNFTAVVQVIRESKAAPE